MPSQRELSRSAFSERSLNYPHHSNAVRHALYEDEYLFRNSTHHHATSAFKGTSSC